MAEILITYGVPTEGFHALANHTLHIPAPCEAYTQAELLALVPRMDAALACKAFDREVIEAAKRLRLIVCYGAGYDAIDVRAATERGIMVANTPDCVTAPTAELAMGLMLSLARRLGVLNQMVRAVPPREMFVMGRHMGDSLEGATLGIVGMGRIGARMADFGRFMGMKVLYTSRSPKPERDALGDERVELAELMRRSDFVSLHCPSTPQTRGMISHEMLSLMKPTAYLINTARGAVVDENALLDALRERRIAGAGLDVFVDEPDMNPAFFALDNVLLTPHVGTNTLHARNRMAEEASERILAVFRGELPRNLLNPEVVGTPAYLARMGM